MQKCSRSQLDGDCKSWIIFHQAEHNHYGGYYYIIKKKQLSGHRGVIGIGQDLLDKNSPMSISGLLNTVDDKNVFIITIQSLKNYYLKCESYIKSSKVS